MLLAIMTTIGACLFLFLVSTSVGKRKLFQGGKWNQVKIFRADLMTSSSRYESKDLSYRYLLKDSIKDKMCIVRGKFKDINMYIVMAFGKLES